ncbi:MAG: A/G-specific adenine glycosylase, partial [Acidothermales bacterium]|nr:A/G-specific adenine glycosylase [Acidothermales bacterium]
MTCKPSTAWVSCAPATSGRDYPGWRSPPSSSATSEATVPPPVSASPPPANVAATVLSWYDVHARDLPWRRPEATPWGVLVSEVMLQQTPVSRVLPAYAMWLARWPTPAVLAVDPPGEAVRAWGRLGYPRRALRLHQAATAIVAHHGGQVPASYDELRALPGVGDYTAAAVTTFAFRHRHAVVDTNVRRVLARLLGGVEFPLGAGVTATDRRVAATLLPDDPVVAARWAVALMELGALVCTARAPRCGACPLADRCAWRQAGRPVYT